MSQTVPLPANLSREGLASICLLLGAIILWVTEAMPLAISTILIVILMPFFKVMEISQIWPSFSNSIFFFILATFAMTGALVTSNIPTRIASLMLSWAGNNSRKLVMGFVFVTAVLSSIMSNVPTCALFVSLGISIVKANGNQAPGKSNLGKALMIGIPAGAVLGGFMTPAGTSTNILAISLIKQFTGVTITFLDWMIVGIPMGIIGILIVSFWITVVFKPEPITQSALDYAKQKVDETGALSAKEIKTMIIIALMFVFWISGTWFPTLNTTIVALFGMVAFFLPGINVLTWKTFTDNAGWDVLFMVGGVNTLAAGILGTGAAGWIVSSVMSGAAVWPPMLTLILISAIAAGLHILIPSGPAVAGLAVIPMIEVAYLADINFIAVAVITAFWSGVTFMLPIDAVPLLTYGSGYYKMTDMMKTGWLPTVVLIFITAFFIPPVMGLLGY